MKKETYLKIFLMIGVITLLLLPQIIGSGRLIDPGIKFVPYSGATSNVDLGIYNITSAFFKGDGSLLTGITGGIWTNVSGTATYGGNVSIGGNLTFAGSNNPSYIFGGDTAGDDLRIRANTEDGSSYISMDGGGIIRLSSGGSAWNIILSHTGGDFMWFRKGLVQFVSSATKGPAWDMDFDTVTEGLGLKLDCKGITNGTCLYIDSPNI